MSKEELLELFREEIQNMIPRFVERNGCQPDALFMSPDFARERFGTTGEDVMVFDGLLVMVTLAASAPELACMSMILEHLPEAIDPRTRHRTKNHRA